MVWVRIHVQPHSLANGNFSIQNLLDHIKKELHKIDLIDYYTNLASLCYFLWLYRNNICLNYIKPQAPFTIIQHVVALCFNPDNCEDPNAPITLDKLNLEP